MIAIGAFTRKGETGIGGCVGAAISDAVAEEETVVIADGFIDAAVVLRVEVDTSAGDGIVVGIAR